MNVYVCVCWWWPICSNGIVDKSKGGSTFAGVRSSYDEFIKYYNENPLTDGLERFDYCLNAVAGTKFSRMMFALDYGWGLTKINNAQTNNS